MSTKYHIGQRVRFYDGAKMHAVKIEAISAVFGVIYYTFRGETIQGTSTEGCLREAAK